MKRIFALCLALCLLLPLLAFAEPEITTEISDGGLTVERYHQQSETQYQTLSDDYPVFVSDDEELAAFLTQNITQSILSLRRVGKLAQDSVYAGGEKDYIRCGFFASLDFPGLLSVEATVTNRPAGSDVEDTVYLYRLIDLARRATLTLYDLFDATQEDVDAAVQQAAFDIASERKLLLPALTSASQMPKPASYFVSSDSLRCTYPSDVSAGVASIDIPWPKLNLTFQPLLAAAALPASTPLPPALTSAPSVQPALTSAPSVQPAQTLPPLSSVVTPSPMPLGGTDAEIQAVLT
ncbi:MAG: hypothetical protein EOM69_10665, partial [Clostridia bacterium]|nr:hypothetical protein [Clostridia bacterium]